MVWDPSLDCVEIARKSLELVLWDPHFVGVLAIEAVRNTVPVGETVHLKSLNYRYRQGSFVDGEQHPTRRCHKAAIEAGRSRSRSLRASFHTHTKRIIPEQ